MRVADKVIFGFYLIVEWREIRDIEGMISSASTFVSVFGTILTTSTLLTIGEFPSKWILYSVCFGSAFFFIFYSYIRLGKLVASEGDTLASRQCKVFAIGFMMMSMLSLVLAAGKMVA